MKKSFFLHIKGKNLPLPEEIKAIRNKYNLTQKAFSILLGFGEKTITRYENGSIQDDTHNLLIKLMDDQETFKKVWKIRKNLLTEKEMKNDEDMISKDDMLNN